ncbi:MAG TPA: acylphosphatase [Gammaproteobacteria bacterium]|nr:acylphosphatase [Gammaproteobacteria bacterium]
MTQARAIRCVVAGRVQGVYYRAATAEQATRLQLDGWVKNLADGRVEVVAAGSQPAIAELAGWLWQGPPAARVEAVHLEEWSGEVQRGFVVVK